MENQIQLQLHHFCIINYNYVIGPSSGFYSALNNIMLFGHVHILHWIVLAIKLFYLLALQLHSEIFPRELNSIVAMVICNL